MSSSSKSSPAIGFSSTFFPLYVSFSLFLFTAKNVLFTGWSSANSAISPLRWVSATVVPVIAVSWGHQKRSLSTFGALLAVVGGFVLSLAHYSFFLSLLAFLVSSSRASKYKKAGAKGDQRSLLQVFCTGGTATWLAVLYLLDVGSADLPVDFRLNYRSSWLGMGVLGAFSCCTGDAFASALGSRLANDGDVFLITTFEKVPKGTNGGVSFIGLASSLIGGLVIGVAYFMGILMSVSQVAPCQLLVILVGGLGGLLGSLLDSLIGATLQFSGKDVKTGEIVEVAREGVVPISGKMVLDNNSVDLISSILTALILPKMALAMGL